MLLANGPSSQKRKLEQVKPLVKGIRMAQELLKNINLIITVVTQSYLVWLLKYFIHPINHTFEYICDRHTKCHKPNDLHEGTLLDLTVNVIYM